jgi:hypothetical protein
VGMTRAVPLLVALLLLSSCSDDPDPRSYDSVADMGETLEDAGIGCGDLVNVEPPEGEDANQRLPEEAGSCGEVQLFLFEDEAARDKWLTLGTSFSGNVVSGPNWTVIAPDETTADEIADALGGET